MKIAKTRVFIILTFLPFVLNAQWYDVNSNTTENLNDIFFIDSLVGYCSGGGDQFGFPDGNGIVLETIDGGENWAPMFSQDSLAIQHLALVETGNDNIKLYGFAMKNGTPYLVSTFVSTEFQNWSVVEVPYQADQVAVKGNVVYFKDQNTASISIFQADNVNEIVENVYLFGLNNFGLTYLDQQVDSVIFSEDYENSPTFTKGIPENFTQNNTLNAQTAFFGDTLVLKGTYPPSVNFITANDSVWTTYFHENAPSGVCNILNASTIHGVDNFQRIVVTTNSGETWQIQDSLGVAIRKIYFYNESMGFAVGENGKIFKTSNLGGVTGIDDSENLKKKISIFPNPSSNQVNIQVDEGVVVRTVELMDINGKVVKSFSAVLKQLDLSGLSAGTYILRIGTDQGEVSKRVVVE